MRNRLSRCSDLTRRRVKNFLSRRGRLRLDATGKTTMTVSITEARAFQAIDRAQDRPSRGARLIRGLVKRIRSQRRIRHVHHGDLRVGLHPNIEQRGWLGGVDTDDRDRCGADAGSADERSERAHATSPA